MGVTLALSNLDRYKKDLDALVTRGETLDFAMQYECFPEVFKRALNKEIRDKEQAADTLNKLVKALPALAQAYQPWYSEAKALIRQLLPDRLADFVRHYEKPKPRKEITNESYRIEDYLLGLNVTRGSDNEMVVGPDAAIGHLRQ